MALAAGKLLEQAQGEFEQPWFCRGDVGDGWGSLAGLLKSQPTTTKPFHFSPAGFHRAGEGDGTRAEKAIGKASRGRRKEDRNRCTGSDIQI